jgi:predicted PurR-regulated permease PerM
LPRRYDEPRRERRVLAGGALQASGGGALMVRPRATERLRFTPRSLVVAVGLLGLTLALLRLLATTTRVIGWVLAATTIAGLLYPLVARLQRWMPRAVAVMVVAFLSLGAVATVTYGIVDELVRETHVLQDAAPDVGQNLENSNRFGDLATRLKLTERLTRFAEEVPNKLRGGDTAQALRAAATRGVAFLVTGVLSLFLLLHGPRLLSAGLQQIRDPVRRERIATVAWRAYRRAWVYIAGSIAMAIASGLLAFGVAREFGVPGAAPLAVWVALWDVVPVVGAPIGIAPIVALAATLQSPRRGVLVALILLAYAVFEALVLQKLVERESLRLGPFITIVAGIIGVELYGAGGALLLVVFATLGVAVLAELAPLDDEVAMPDPAVVPEPPPASVAEPEEPTQPSEEVLLATQPPVRGWRRWLPRRAGAASR